MVELLLRRRVEREDDVPTVGRNVEHARIGVAAWQFERAAFEQVTHAAGGHVQHMKVGHAAHRQVVVPKAVLGLAGGVAGFLAVLEFLEAFGLRLAALGVGPDPGDEGDALAVGEPLEGFDAGREVAAAARLAAIGRNHIELRRFVLLALLLAFGNEGDAVAFRRPRGLAVFARRSQPRVG